jgi:hypothetical protein
MVVMADSYHRLWKIFISTNLIYLLVIGFIVFKLVYPDQNQTVESVRTYEQERGIYSLLRSSGMSIGQVMDIADTVVQQSRNFNLPISLILAVMKKESQFNPSAISHMGAIGIMQIHPPAWVEFTRRLGLNLSLKAASDPVVNIIIGTTILKSLFELYESRYSSSAEIERRVLAAYRDGIASISKTGIGRGHAKYISDIKKFREEFRWLD